MSNAKALPAAAPAAGKKSVRPPGELRRSIQLINRFIEGQRGTFGLAVLMLVLESLTSIGAKYPLKWLIDYLQQGSAQPIADDVAKSFGFLPAAALASVSQFFLGLSLTGVLIFLSVAILLIALFNSAADSLSEIYLVRGGRQLGFQVRARLYDHLQKLSLAFFGQQRTGDLLARVTGDVTALEEFAVKSLKDIAGSILLIALTLVVLFITSWQMGLIALVTVPILSLASNYFADRIKAGAKKQRAREGELAAAAQEMLTSIRVIQTYGGGGDQQRRFAETSRNAMDVAVQVGRLQAWFGGAISLLQAVVVVIIVWVSVSLVGAGAITFGATVLFISLIQDLFKPTKRIIKQWNEVGKIIASAERISEVLDRKPAVQDEPGAVEAPLFSGRIEYRGVSFAYQSEGEEGAPLRLALRDVSFSVSPGEVVALVGGSGAGKSTIAQLLPRLYDPHAGQVLIDGQDIRGFTLDSLRSRMSMVLQETILFTGTVAENISYGRQDATREEIIAAAIQASAHEFIEKLPQGYDTPLSERAANLSGGQRQRIAIARAFVRRAPMLILDEPTTGLDAESSDLVRLALRALMKDTSTIIISHDLNLIRHADRILVVKQGVIDQVGTHRDLLKAGGLYADLYHRQFSAAVEEHEARPSVLLPPAPALVSEDEDEEAAPAPRGVFQTMISQALPAPVSRRAFETILMQSPVLPPASALLAASAAAPVAPASASAPDPVVDPAVSVAPAAPTPLARAADAAPRPLPSAQTPAPAPAPAADGKPKPRSPLATTLLRISPEELEAARERSVGEQTPAPVTPVAGPDQPQPVPATRELVYDPADSPALHAALPGLARALDPEVMRDLLQAALFGRINPSATITRCKPGEAGVAPSGECMLRYKLTVESSDGRTSEVLVSGRVMASQLDCALYMRDRLGPVVALLRGRPELALLRAPAAMLEPLNMVVYAFPVDGELPTLAAATHPERVAEVVGEALGGDDPAPLGACSVELVDYGRQGRATLRYRVDGGVRGRARTFYGKLNADGSGAFARPITEALRERARGSFAVPRTLAWRADLKLSLLEEVRGLPIIPDVLEARLMGKELPASALSLEEMIEHAGRIAAALHGSGVRFGRRRALDDELASLRAELALVQRYTPELGAVLDAAMRRIEAHAEQSDPLELRLSHGDYTHGQLLFDGPSVGLIDFDSICQAEPALDLAQFLVYLRIAARKAEPAAGELLGDLSERFLEAYVAADVPEDADRLRVRIAVYRVVSLLRRTLRSWQKLKGSRARHAAALLEEELACLPQLDS
ncbi:MAG: hypothetical protein RLZZ387_3076 [Chloroflexota bacterium]|jgi:ABC-type multidrug transport system fused ATPase/permease subunit